MALDAAALFREHSNELFRYLVRLTGNETLARDVVQDSFVRLLEHRPDDTNPRAWLYRVATNVVRDRHRAERRHARLLEERAHQVPVPAGEAAPDERYEQERAAAQVRAALDSLSERDRTLLLMREEGFPHREIADAVGTTTGSVGTMIARALGKLSSALATAEGGGS